MRNGNGTRLCPIIGTDLYAEIVLSVFQFFHQLETIKFSTMKGLTGITSCAVGAGVSMRGLADVISANMKSCS